MILLMALPAAIDRNIPAVVVPVKEVPTHDGQPISVSPGITLTMTDGFTVTMSQKENEFDLNHADETDQQYTDRLVDDLCEARPVFCDWSPNDPS